MPQSTYHVFLKHGGEHMLYLRSFDGLAYANWYVIDHPLWIDNPDVKAAMELFNLTFVPIGGSYVLMETAGGEPVNVWEYRGVTPMLVSSTRPTRPSTHSAENQS